MLVQVCITRESGVISSLLTCPEGSWEVWAFCSPSQLLSEPSQEIFLGTEIDLEQRGRKGEDESREGRGEKGGRQDERMERPREGCTISKFPLML